MEILSMKKIAVLLLLPFLIVSCSNSSNSRFSSQDLVFAEMMIPHHEQAIEMSNLALMNSQDPEILKLAQEIKDAQAPEIEQMKSWGASSMAHAGHMMDGMLSEDEINELSAAKGSDFDRIFLEGMIKHHEGAIDMAEMVTDSKNAEVAALAKVIIETQRTEISLMKNLLQR